MKIDARHVHRHTHNSDESRWWTRKDPSHLSPGGDFFPPFKKPVEKKEENKFVTWFWSWIIEKLSVKFRLVLHWGGQTRGGQKRRGGLLVLPFFGFVTKDVGGADNLTTPKSSYNTHVSAGWPSYPPQWRKNRRRRQKNDSSQTHHPSGRYWRSSLTADLSLSLFRPRWWCTTSNYIVAESLGKKKRSAYIRADVFLMSTRTATTKTRTSNCFTWKSPIVSRPIYICYIIINRKKENKCVGVEHCVVIVEAQGEQHDGPYLSVCV